MAGEPPLIAGRIHGIRRWTVGWKAGDADLRGFADARWVAAGRPTRARCQLHSRRSGHRAPGRRCSCGLYALHTWGAPRHLPDDPAGPPDEVFGIVEAWGRVELHEDGFRAQFARPVALALVGFPRDSDAGEAVARLAGRYRAEVIEVASPHELGEHCRERGWGLSREVVRSLLAEVAEEAPEPAAAGSSAGTAAGSSAGTAAGSSARSRTEPSRLARIAETVGIVLTVLVGIVWYGFLALVAVTIAISIINGDFGSSGEGFSDRKLRVLDQALVRRGDDRRYVAVVRNTSEKRIALAAFARGEVLGRDGRPVARLGDRRKAETRPTLLPGETGVIVDVLPGVRPVPERLRFETEVLARRAPAGRAKPALVLGEPVLERERCRLTVPVDAGLAARGAEITIVAGDGTGEISAAGSVALEREAVKRGRQVIPLVESGGCPDWLQRVATYPLVLPRHVRDGG